MREPLIAGNWKMHGSRAMAQELARDLVAGLGADGPGVLVLPPALYIPDVLAAVDGNPRVRVGAQNVADADEGAYTGEISGAMLRDVGCHHALVGHSERRTLYGEDNVLVARRFAAARRAGITPILCVGETLAERDADATADVVARQLDAVFDAVGDAAFDAAVVAYEPVWAIGTGRSAGAAEAQDVHRFIREQLGRRDQAMAARTPILYGGSVKPDSAGALLAEADIDGCLVGGASLQAKDFLAIAAHAR